MPYWRLFYHLIWTTKEREPLIDPVRAGVIEQSLRSTCEEPAVRLFAIGIMPDHAHLVVSIPPRLAIASVVQRLKGASSYAANGPDFGDRASRFAWQAEYGVLSFSEKALPTVIDDARNQQTRHATNDLWPTLERINDP